MCIIRYFEVLQIMAQGMKRPLNGTLSISPEFQSVGYKGRRCSMFKYFNSTDSPRSKPQFVIYKRSAVSRKKRENLDLLKTQLCRSRSSRTDRINTMERKAQWIIEHFFFHQVRG
ncbi:hypothetical protein JTB14_018796 [Gonioctena quinquepunctata]|nr:hypothetical protein JTB14_018796 [Gonioctena quinquepunctata]